MQIPEARVGIWWNNGSTIVALTHALNETVTRIGNRIDSDLAHVDEWPRVAKKLGRTIADEYFCVPRGRVVFDVKSRRGIILHGPATSPERLELIAQRFGLGENWKAEQDTHYFTGDDADRLFDDEE
jgi:hypothetical protein